MCKAAIHSGAIDISGGKITLTVIDTPPNGYLSEFQNSVFSQAKEFLAADKVAFKVESMVTQCPEDMLKRYGLNTFSFLQSEMSVGINPLYGYNSGKNDLKDILNTNNGHDANIDNLELDGLDLNSNPNVEGTLGNNNTHVGLMGG